MDMADDGIIYWEGAPDELDALPNLYARRAARIAAETGKEARHGRWLAELVRSI